MFLDVAFIYLQFFNRDFKTLLPFEALKEEALPVLIIPFFGTSKQLPKIFKVLHPKEVVHI
jgi:hypothetical protein